MAKTYTSKTTQKSWKKGKSLTSKRNHMYTKTKKTLKIWCPRT